MVPRLHLRGFATPKKRIMHLDLSSGGSREIGIGDAAVIRDFYTVTLPDGTRSDAWEQWLGDLENETAPALRRAIEMPHFRLSDEDRARLARWIALQYLRGPDQRRQMADIASFTIRTQVGMGGLAYLQHTMSQGLDRRVPADEAERVWADITSPEGPDIVVDGDEHLAVLARTFDQAAALIFGRSWGRIQFNRYKLAVSDAPVNLVRGDTPDHLGAGLVAARALTVPLDRQTLLWLDLPEDGGPAEDRDLEPTAFLARAHNTSAVLGAERFVYFHPDDHPIPTSVAIPRPGPKKLAISGGNDLVNRDRPLAEVLDQIALHTDRSGSVLIADYSWPIPGHRLRDP